VGRERRARLLADAGASLALALATGVIYLRGWYALRAQMPERFTPARLAAFAGGLAAIAIALASPLDAFAGLLLRAHMLQHVLLTMIAPPLLWIGAPALPLLRPTGRRRWRGLGPFLAWPPLLAARALVHPLVGWLALALATLLWHLPGRTSCVARPRLAPLRARLLPRRGPALLVSVIQPYPSRPHWPRWAIVPYLLLADVEHAPRGGVRVRRAAVVLRPMPPPRASPASTRAPIRRRRARSCGSRDRAPT
jgi:cytochrome c oxidase assembly factor CtaG